MLYLSHRVWYSFQPVHSEKTDVLLNSSIKQVGLYFIPPLYQGPSIFFSYSPLIFIFFENLLCSRNFDDLFENSPGVFYFLSIQNWNGLQFWINAGTLWPLNRNRCHLMWKSTRTPLFLVASSYTCNTIKWLETVRETISFALRP